MSALAWLFGLGALTVAFPFLFHLIRRTPKGQTEFSSLMFLRASPPKLTQRSRLENWLLLLLRCAVILLVALAFMRPYFRDGTQIPLVNIPGRNVAILIDTSVSMKRGEIWSDAQNAADELIGQMRDQDRVGLFSFDSSLRTVVDFPEDLNDVNLPSMKGELQQLSPSWHESNLGVAIASIADRLAAQNDADRTQISAQIYVVTDFQQSSKLDALQSVQWPANVKLRVISIDSDTSNASVQILRTSEENADGAPETARVRIRNQLNSQADQFTLRWNSSLQDETQLTDYVAPGSSRVINTLRPESQTEYIELLGDECDFDNRFYTIPPEQQVYTVSYLGSADPDDPEELRYYFSRAMAETPFQKVEVISNNEIEGRTPNLILVADPVNQTESEQIDQFLEDGGMVLFVASDADRAKSFSNWIGGNVDESIRRPEDYQLLAEIDFQHPLFAAFDSPRFNDFTRIKFWEHSRIKLDVPNENQVLAKFDNGAPAIWTRSEGAGRVMCMSFGWQPSQSQLALSTKFLPIVNEVVEMAIKRPDPIQGCVVGQSVQLGNEQTQLKVITPDKEQIELSDSSSGRFTETDVPGIYEVYSGATRIQKFAVNVSAAESETFPMGIEQLEALGVSTGEQVTAEEKAKQMRILKDTQLESQQKIWKWAIVIALLVIMLESWLAAKRSSGITNPNSLEAPA